MIERYEDYPRIVEDGRVVENFMPTYNGRWVKYEDVSKKIKQLNERLSKIEKLCNNISNRLFERS